MSFNKYLTLSLLLPVALCVGISLTLVTGVHGDTVTVPLAPYKAVVHQSSAEVFSTATINLSAGQHVLQLENLTAVVEEEIESKEISDEERSLEVKVNGAVARRVTWATQFVVGDRDPRRIELKKVLEQLQEEFDLTEADITSQDRALGNLDSFSTAVASFKGDSLLRESETAVQVLTGIHPLRFSAKRELVTLQAKREALRAKLAETRQRLAELHSLKRVALVHLRIVEAGEVTIKTSVVVKNAGWTPSYDLSIDTVNGELKVTYNAMVMQGTPQDWVDIQLDLCTGEPTKDRTIPTLRPEILELGAARQTPQPTEKRDDKRHGGLSEVYQLQGKHSLPALNQGARVQIAELMFKIELTFIALPRISSKVFLRGDVINSSPYTLLPGPALLFSDGVLVGDTALPFLSHLERTSIELGSDPRFEAKRQLEGSAVEYEHHLFGPDDRVETFSYYLSISSKKTQGSVLVQVQDTVPLPKELSDTITVKLQEPHLPQPLSRQSLASGVPIFPPSANVSVTSEGILTWSRWITPGRTIFIPFKFQVKTQADKIWHV